MNFSVYYSIWHIALSVIIFAFGACIGSFLNVCIYRIPRELSVIKPRSHCTSCNKIIPWYLNIPILSYIFLRGRCRFCGKKFSSRYMVVEITTATLFLMTWLKLAYPYGAFLGMSPISDVKLIPVYWLVIGGLLLGSFVDFEHLIIPDRVTLGGIFAGIILSLLFPSLHNTQSHLSALYHSIIGAVSGWVILWIIGFIGKLIFQKEAMGFGDVKLIGAIGAFLGWKAVIFTIVVSSFFGALVGSILVLSKCKKMQSRIPYGPYLSLAAILWIFWGEKLWLIYINILMPQTIMF